MQRVAAKAPAAQNDPKVQALVAEFLQEKRREIEEEAKVTKWRSARYLVVAGLSLVCLAAWLAPYPSPSAYLRPDPKVELASGRMTLFLAAQSVTHFRATRGRLPITLVEAGVEGAKIVYNPGTEGSFTLSTHVRDQGITYDSSAPLQSILGQAEEVISQTGH